jgi:membrane protease YdiL (CAAX protease family)
MSLSYTTFVALTLLFVGLVGYATYRSAQILPDWPADQNPLLHPAETGVRFILIGFCISLGLLSGESQQALGWVVNHPLSQIAWGTLWGILLALFYIITTRWVMARSGKRYYTTTVVRVIVPRSTQQVWAVAAVMVSVVLLEELLFRSLLLGGFAPLLPTWLLLAIGALIFGLMHSPQGLWGMVAIAMGGILLGLMFVTTQSLLMPAVAHYVINMVQIGYAYWRGVPELPVATLNS